MIELVEEADSRLGIVFSSDTPFTFDGHEFSTPRDAPHFAAWIANLDIAYRARRGDEGAVNLLTAVNIRITDCGGKKYWPMDVTT